MSAATKSLRCLIVEDEDADARLMLRQLRVGGYDVAWERVDTPEAMRAALERQPWDVVLSDYRMPRFSGLAALEILRASGLDLPFIIVSGTIGEETAVAAMQAGVDDYLIKGELAHLTVAVERELRNAATRRERKTAEAAKAASQQLLEEITDNSSSLIYSLDLEGRFLLVNRALERVFGVPRETIIGHPRETIMPPEIAAAHRANDLKVMQDGRPLTIEEENSEPDGKHTYLSVKFPLVDASGHLHGIGGISTDINERKRTDAALRQQAEELRTKNDVLERFNSVAVGRERRMFELKREMNELCAKLGEPPRFRIATIESAETEGAGGVSPSRLMHQIFPTDVRILVVDDDPEILKGTARLLEMAGYAVDLAATGDAALRSVQARPPDLLLLDRSLPGIDGLEVCRRIKRDPALADILVVIVSGKKVASTDQAEGLEAGADGYIARPIANCDLLAQVEAYARIVGVTRSLRLRDAAVQKNTVAALNLMEDAVEARNGLEAANQGLRREIAEREQAEAALRASEERYRMLFDQNPVPMWLYDVATLAFLAVNETAVGKYGYTREEFLGLTLRRICCPDDVPILLERIAAESTANGSACALRHVRKDGTTLHVESVSRPLTFAGRAARLSLVTDVTEKKQLEEKFLHAQRLESIGMLAAGIAHDLNNILTPIMMSTSLLRDALRDDENRQLIDSMQSSAQRGADIIRQLLTFARGQPGVRAPVRVRQLLREMEKLIRETFPRNLCLAVTGPLELWPVVGDATQIHQALMNLCVNARDAMPDGGTLTLAADNVILDAASVARMPGTKPGPHVRLCVTDTGTGIPPAQLEHIFDPFFTTKGIGKGTGLGLPTVLGIVRGHGGAVRVDSRVGQGTTFELYLPASLEAKPADTAEREVRMPRGHGELILVVDDEATVRGTTQRVLEKSGYRVLAAAEGEAALVLYAQHRTAIKAVLADMMMPGMDGPKLVRALRQLDARLPILGMTGLIKQGPFKGLDGLDAVPLLAKPFEVEKLLEALRQTLTAGNPTTGPAN